MLYELVKKRFVVGSIDGEERDHIFVLFFSHENVRNDPVDDTRALIRNLRAFFIEQIAAWFEDKRNVIVEIGDIGRFLSQYCSSANTTTAFFESKVP